MNDGADFLAQADESTFDGAYDALAQVGFAALDLYNNLDEKDTDKIYNGMAQTGTMALNWLYNIDDHTKSQVSDMLAQAASNTGYTPDQAMEMAQEAAEEFGVFDMLNSFAQVEDEDYY